MERLRIAVVGAGVAGLTAAYILQRAHDVTLFEKNDYLGGHTNTFTVPDGPDAGTPVDTGFIVMNHRNYPLLTRLFNQLGVELRDSDMSFGYWCQHTGLQYSGSGPGGMFAQRRNLFRPAFHGLLRSIMRFYREANADLVTDNLGDQSLGDYLKRGRYSDWFIHHHLLPMGAAIWSTPCERMQDFPAASFLHFFRNHGLLALKDRPQWRTVVGGSQIYVGKMRQTFTGPVNLDMAVEAVSRRENSVDIRTADGVTASFDRVVIATHADEAWHLLTDPSDHEADLLKPWEYAVNRAALHTDTAVLPPIRRAWSSWNFTREEAIGEEQPISLTYDMNRLQGLETSHRYLVSLNRRQPVKPEALVMETTYTHPMYTSAAMATQPRLTELNGHRNTYFCGSYFGYGFHEDAVRSAVLMARKMGLDL
jgi:predicted NAD/FAD-binding protein